MYKVRISTKFLKILRKIEKKDKNRFLAVKKKINQIAYSKDLDCYKNLRHDQTQLKRVHVDSHFVFDFKIDKKENFIEFHDFQHHNKIYKR